MTTLQEDIREWRHEKRREMRERSEHALSNADEFIRSIPYAALGSAIYNFSRVRNALRTGFELPSRILQSTRQTPDRLRETYDDRVERGRRAISRASDREAVENAKDQVRTAKRKAKGAATSAGRAARGAATAVEEAAEAAFDPRDARAYEERTYEELRELASEREIDGRSTMNKSELIEALRRDR